MQELGSQNCFSGTWPGAGTGVGCGRAEAGMLAQKPEGRRHASPHCNLLLSLGNFRTGHPCVNKDPLGAGSAKEPCGHELQGACKVDEEVAKQRTVRWCWSWMGSWVWNPAPDL